MYNQIKTDKEIEAMRSGGKILAQILRETKDRVKAGVSTKSLADYVAKRIQDFDDVTAVTLGYQGYPDVICISVNDEVVHGIPKESVILKDGDVVSLDFVVRHKGMVTDAATTTTVGNTDKKIQRLIKTTERSLYDGIQAIKGETRVGDIAAAVENTLKNSNLGVVKDMVGHGVGHEMHEEPNIPNYGQKGSGPLLRPGMTVAIEPMATLGTDRIYVDKDGWTIKTADQSIAAHFEHTILVTEHGYEILTQE